MPNYLPPGARGYLAGEESVQRQQQQNLGSLATLMQLEERKRASLQDQAFRGELQALGPNPDQGVLAQLAAKYSKPADVLKSQQSSLDRQATIDATRESNLARIEAAKEAKRLSLDQAQRHNEMMHEFRMRGAKTDADRAAETARHNQVTEGLQAELLKLKQTTAAQGKAIPSPLQKQLTEASELTDATERFRTTFKPEFAGKTVTGDLGNVYGRIMGDTTGQSQWWQDYELHQSQVRNKLFGSALTAPEIEAWNKSAINPRMDPDEVRKNLVRRDQLERKGLEKLIRGATAGGYNKEQIEAFTGRSAPSVPSPSAPGRLKFDAQGNPL